MFENAGLVMELLSNTSISPRIRHIDRLCGQRGPIQGNESLVDQRGRNRDLPRSEQEPPTLGYLNLMHRDRRR